MNFLFHFCGFHLSNRGASYLHACSRCANESKANLWVLVETDARVEEKHQEGFFIKIFCFDDYLKLFTHLNFT